MEGESGVKQTSILVFHSIPPEEFRGFQENVSKAIAENGPVCDKTGVLKVKLEKNVYIPRQNDLIEKELVRTAGVFPDPENGNMVIHVVVW